MLQREHQLSTYNQMQLSACLHTYNTISFSGVGQTQPYCLSVQFCFQRILLQLNISAIVYNQVILCAVFSPQLCSQLFRFLLKMYFRALYSFFIIYSHRK
ncbi:Hypothetical_protein [Hexamita inflata]|uniref:Hypothetical_protein n=1 Tax=Hexamita inflata TaxID=28002 RepID=A0AA86NKH7_9EUKA|nr:Hypothetical protein HINF_LOCUS8546 [Hexamita inflata]